MAGFTDFVGLVSGYIRLGLSGVRLKNNSGVLDVRNAGDSAYANVAANRVSIVDPANPARSVGLDSPTLGASWAMTLPSSLGAAGQGLRRAGAGGSEWAYPVEYANTRRVSPLTAINGGYGSGSTLYNLSVGGSRESLWDRDLGVWRQIEIPYLDSLDFASAYGNQRPFCPHDIYMYYDPSTGLRAYYVSSWSGSNAGKSITGVTNASPPVATVGASHGFTVGDMVVIHGITGAASSLNNKLYRVSATAATTITLQTMETVNAAAPGSYTSGGTAYKVVTGLSRPLSLSDYGNGIQVADLTSILGGSTVYGKLIATVAYGEVLNTIADLSDRPFVCNLYNTEYKPIGSLPTNTTGDSWSVNTTAHTSAGSRAQNNSLGLGRQWTLAALDYRYGSDVHYRTSVLPPGATSENTAYVLYLAKNSPTAQYDGSTPDLFSNPAVNAHVQGSVANAGDRYNFHLTTDLNGWLPIGLNYWQAMEFVHNSGSNNWTAYRNFVGGTANQYVIKNGFFGGYER